MEAVPDSTFWTGPGEPGRVDTAVLGLGSRFSPRSAVEGGNRTEDRVAAVEVAGWTVRTAEPVRATLLAGRHG